MAASGIDTSKLDEVKSAVIDAEEATYYRSIANEMPKNMRESLKNAKAGDAVNWSARLNAAIAKNRAAALQSASWGIGQVMGENFAAAGFSDVEAMVSSMMLGEDEQLTAMANFLLKNKLATPLRSHDWATFARGYNGKDFAINKYDVNLNAEFQKLSISGVPDLVVRAAQLYLIYLGFDPHGVDGVAGKNTLSALADFQNANGFPVTTSIDAATVTQLQNALA